MLGDIGGLFDALYYLSLILIYSTSICVTSGLDSFLVKRLFKRETKAKTDLVTRLEKRQPLEMKNCLLSWLRDKKSHRIYTQAVESYQQELDIIHFIQLQKITSSLHKMFYSKTERYLMQRNKCFLVDDRSTKRNHDEEYLIEQMDRQELDCESKHFDLLLSQTTLRKNLKRSKSENVDRTAQDMSMDHLQGYWREQSDQNHQIPRQVRRPKNQRKVAKLATVAIGE